MAPRQRRKFCKECPPGSRREAKYPGPRCFSHHTARKSAQSAARKAKHVEDTFGITEEEYQAIYKAQGGYCYICRRAKGTGRRRLAVDHDHKCNRGHAPEVGCRYCVRGLCCKSCNRGVLGHLRDEIAAFERGIEYLTNPPARAVLGPRWFERGI